MFRGTPYTYVHLVFLCPSVSKTVNYLSQKSSYPWCNYHFCEEGGGEEIQFRGAGDVQFIKQTAAILEF